MGLLSDSSQDKNPDPYAKKSNTQPHDGVSPTSHVKEPTSVRNPVSGVSLQHPLTSRLNEQAADNASPPREDLKQAPQTIENENINKQGCSLVRITNKFAALQEVEEEEVNQASKLPLDNTQSDFHSESSPYEGQDEVEYALSDIEITKGAQSKRCKNQKRRITPCDRITRSVAKQTASHHTFYL